MDELTERRMRAYEETWRLRMHPRVAALTARIDSGEAQALDELERRLQEDYGYLVAQGKPELADACWGWGVARIEDVECAEEYAEREDDAPAPERWRGLRVRVTHVAGAGLTRPVQIAGRLAGVTERGLHVLTDELEEEQQEGQAGSILRRVKAERLVTWGSLLTVQPLPVREVFSMEANVREHEDAVAYEQDAGDPPERL
ncbi:MAG: hypothetical protein M3Q49_07970 [Actinomycetota bacterium]|nr:hypothetical protein [Actinomycetota bacterium]